PPLAAVPEVEQCPAQARRGGQVEVALQGDDACPRVDPPEAERERDRTADGSLGHASSSTGPGGSSDSRSNVCPGSRRRFRGQVAGAAVPRSPFSPPARSAPAAPRD